MPSFPNRLCLAGLACLTVFMIMTAEGWSSVMDYLSEAWAADSSMQVTPVQMHYIYIDLFENLFCPAIFWIVQAMPHIRNTETLRGFVYEALPGQFPYKIARQIEFSKRSIALVALPGPDPSAEERLHTHG